MLTCESPSLPVGQFPKRPRTRPIADGWGESSSHPVGQFPKRPRTRPIGDGWDTYKNYEKTFLGESLCELPKERFDDEPRDDDSQMESEDSHIFGEDEPRNDDSQMESEDSHIFGEDIIECDGYIGEWTPEIDEVMAETLLNEASKGNKLDRGLIGIKIILGIIEDIYKKFNAVFSQTRVCIRLCKYARDSERIQEITKKDGFAWCSKEKKIIADEETWDKEFMENPSSISYWRRTFPVHDKISHLLRVYKEG